MEWMVFGTGFSLSFLGSLPPGAINLSILLKSAGSGLIRGLQWALLAAFIELVFLLAAWQLTQSLDWVGFATRWSRPLAVLALGFLSFREYQKQTRPLNRTPVSVQVFLGINLLNMAAFPFWVGMLQLWPPPPDSGWVFGFGATAGAFLGYGIFAGLGRFWSSAGAGGKVVSTVLALVFGVLALWQAVLWVWF